MASAPVSATTDRNAGGTTLTATFTDATDHKTTAITATGGTDYVDVSSVDTVSIGVLNGATTSAIFTVEKSNDGTNWQTTAYGQGSDASYTQSSLTLTGGSYTILHLPPADLFRYLRINVGTKNSNGTTFTVYGRST